ncbi:MAG: terpene cyclase/mutase family protein [Verrucomicrobiales bacterium]|nr:terpene cyclase/mutase family protein [Verrucomicrobiales bacterium]
MKPFPIQIAVAVFLLAGCSVTGQEKAAVAVAGIDDGFSATNREVTKQEINQSIERGVAFLVEDQNKDGSWGSPRQTKGLNIYAPVPGAHHAFRCAVTAMCVTAIIESDHAKSDDEVSQTLVRGEDYLLKELPKARRAAGDAIYNVWTHGYGIQALTRMHARAESQKNDARASDIRQVIRSQIDRLERYESVDGGWGYYDFRYQTAKPSSSSISFTTATMLVAFKEAEEIEGIDVPDKLIERAIDSINRQRKHDNTYAYGEYLKMTPMRGINRAGGSLGRSQACNIALRMWGDETITDDVLEEWLVRLGKRNGWLSIGRKRPIPHEAWFQVAGYFYYYGHYYAALCIEALPQEKAEKHKNMLAGIMIELQEKDGSWWDYPFYSYHQSYGTAFAVSTLVRCR